MIACTLNSLVDVQDVNISKLWWEIHEQVMAGNSTFLWFHHLTVNVIVSFTSCVFYSIKHNLHFYTICVVLSSTCLKHKYQNILKLMKARSSFLISCQFYLYERDDT